MTERHRLPVGFMTADGESFRTVDLEGHRLAETPARSEDGPPNPRANLDFRCALFQTVDPTRFVVHTVIQQRRGHLPLLGRLTTYSNWRDVVREHPDLARSASFAPKLPPFAPSGTRRGEPRRPSRTEGDEDATSSFP